MGKIGPAQSIASTLGVKLYSTGSFRNLYSQLPSISLYRADSISANEYIYKRERKTVVRCEKKGHWEKEAGRKSIKVREEDDRCER